MDASFKVVDRNGFYVDEFGEGHQGAETLVAWGLPRPINLGPSDVFENARMKDRDYYLLTARQDGEIRKQVNRALRTIDSRMTHRSDDLLRHANSIDQLNAGLTATQAALNTLQTQVPITYETQSSTNTKIEETRRIASTALTSAVSELRLQMEAGFEGIPQHPGMTATIESRVAGSPLLASAQRTADEAERGVQELNRLFAEMQGEIARLRADNQALASRVARLEQSEQRG